MPRVRTTGVSGGGAAAFSGASRHKAALQVILTGGWTPIDVDTSDYNFGGYGFSGSNFLIVPVTGIYKIWSRIFWNDTTTPGARFLGQVRGLAISDSLGPTIGTIYDVHFTNAAIAPGGLGPTQLCFKEVSLLAGAIVGPWVFQDSGFPLDVIVAAIYSPYIGIELIRA